MGNFLAGLDTRIAEIAARQHGVISIWQLQWVGLTKAAVASRVRGGHLFKLFRGVYAVGHPGVPALGMWKAATLALGRQAVLSHVCAAMLWAMLETDDRYPQVTVVGANGRGNRKGMVIHRSVTLGAADITSVKGIPVTRPRRTLDDLRRSEPTWLVRKATRQAEYLGLPLAGLETDGSRGPLETDYLEFFAEIGLPEPEVNAPFGRFAVDFSWDGSLFAIETDAWTGHRGPEQMESDADLGLELAKHGYELIRLTKRQMREKRGEIAALLKKRLAT